MLEKVIQLLHLLEASQAHPFLKNRWALKGGTALNLFVFDVPRLSVDIDLNYVGAADRETMMVERVQAKSGRLNSRSREFGLVMNIVGSLWTALSAARRLALRGARFGT